MRFLECGCGFDASTAKQMYWHLVIEHQCSRSEAYEEVGLAIEDVMNDIEECRGPRTGDDVIEASKWDLANRLGDIPAR